jgi:hypothetical protein
VATVSKKIDEELFVRSKVGRRWRRDHFRKHDTPTHKVTVENRGGEEVAVEVEIIPESEIIDINGERTPWRSGTMTHGGLIEAGNRRTWPHKVTLSFARADQNQQIIQIKVYKMSVARDGQTLSSLVGELRHAVWVK